MGYVSAARCRLVYGPADATDNHSLTVSCFSKIHTRFIFLVLDHKSWTNGR